MSSRGDIIAWTHNDRDATHNHDMWETHIDLNYATWWTMPPVLTDLILQDWRDGAHEVLFVWDWGKPGWGSFKK